MEERKPRGVCLGSFRKHGVFGFVSKPGGVWVRFESTEYLGSFRNQGISGFVSECRGAGVARGMGHRESGRNGEARPPAQWVGGPCGSLALRLAHDLPPSAPGHGGTTHEFAFCSRRDIFLRRAGDRGGGWWWSAKRFLEFLRFQQRNLDRYCSRGRIIVDAHR